METSSDDSEAIRRTFERTKVALLVGLGPLELIDVPVETDNSRFTPMRYEDDMLNKYLLLKLQRTNSGEKSNSVPEMLLKMRGLPRNSALNRSFDPEILNQVLDRRSALFISLNSTTNIEELVTSFADFLSGLDTRGGSPTSAATHDLLEEYTIYVCSKGYSVSKEMESALWMMSKFKQQLAEAIDDVDGPYHEFVLQLIGELSQRDGNVFTEYGEQIATAEGDFGLLNTQIAELWKEYAEGINLIGENGSRTNAGKFLKKAPSRFWKRMRRKSGRK